MRKQRAFATLTEEEIEQIAEWLRTDSCEFVLRACLKMRMGPAAGSFGGWQGGSVSASPQRAVRTEPTQPTGERTAEGLVPIFRQALKHNFVP